MVVEFKWWFKHIAPKFGGFMFFGFVVVRDKSNKRLVNHEKIHVKQMLEMLIIPFYLWYGIEFLLGLTKYKAHESYRNISFEREAYQNDDNLEYLKSRKFWQFLKYLKPNIK